VDGRTYVLFALVGGGGLPAGVRLPPGGVNPPAVSKSYVAFALPR
jgi:quinoprotein glucose dehydrogenase